MSRLAASMVANFLGFLGDAPEPQVGDKQKDVTQRKSLAEVFQEACEPGFRLRSEPDDVSSYESLAQTIRELGL